MRSFVKDILQEDYGNHYNEIFNNSYGAFFSGNLTGFAFALNLITTTLMTISVIATIFSGYEYLKNGKEIFKDC